MSQFGGKDPLDDPQIQAPDGPVATEDTAWRRRAQEAEALAAELRERLEAAERDLGAAREAVDACERSRRIDGALREADAVDLETARLMTEAAVAGMEDPDIALAVRDLRAAKPFLFRRQAGGGGTQAALARDSGGDALERALEEAALTGDRAALLRYLRLRRAGV